MRDLARKKETCPDAAGGTAAYAQLAEIPNEEPEEISETAVTGVTKVVRETLDNVKSEFKEKTWDAFWRVTVDGRSAAAVAEELSLSVKPKNAITSHASDVNRDAGHTSEPKALASGGKQLRFGAQHVAEPLRDSENRGPDRDVSLGETDLRDVIRDAENGGRLNIGAVKLLDLGLALLNRGLKGAKKRG